MDLPLLLWFSTVRIPRQRIGRQRERTTAVFLLSLKLHAASDNYRKSPLWIPWDWSALFCKCAARYTWDSPRRFLSIRPSPRLIIHGDSHRRGLIIRWTCRGRIIDSRLIWEMQFMQLHTTLDAIPTVNRTCDISCSQTNRVSLSLSLAKYILHHYLLTV